MVINDRFELYQYVVSMDSLSFSNSQPVGNLTYSQAIFLLKIKENGINNSMKSIAPESYLKFFY